MRLRGTGDKGRHVYRFAAGLGCLLLVAAVASTRAAPAASGDEVKIYLEKDGNVWVDDRGEKSQITHDDSPDLLMTALSPDKKSIAVVNSNSVIAFGKFSLPGGAFLWRIFDLKGLGLRQGVVIDENGGNGVMDVGWITNDKIYIDVHINPSVGTLHVIDWKLHSDAQYLSGGGDPVWDPSGKYIAFRGWFPHFNFPEEMRVHYIQINGQTVYEVPGDHPPNSIISNLVWVQTEGKDIIYFVEKSGEEKPVLKGILVRDKNGKITASVYYQKTMEDDKNEYKVKWNGRYIMAL